MTNSGMLVEGEANRKGNCMEKGGRVWRPINKILSSNGWIEFWKVLVSGRQGEVLNSEEGVDMCSGGVRRGTAR